MRWPTLVVILLLAAAAALESTAQPAQGRHPAQQAPAAAPASQPSTSQPSTPQSVPVSVEQALYLIRSTLLTLNDANRSGNYTVLRDLASPDFQARNNAADLARIFTDLRSRNFDLFAAALLAPQLTAAPALDANKLLRLTGFFPTRPLQIQFDLIYQTVNGQWRVFGISITTPAANPTTSSKPDAVTPHSETKETDGAGPAWSAADTAALSAAPHWTTTIDARWRN